MPFKETIKRSRRSWRSSRWLATIAVGSAVAVASAADRPLYTVEDLGTLGGDQAAALGANNDGVVVGWSETFEGVRSTFARDTEGWTGAMNTRSPRWHGLGDGVLSMTDGCFGPMTFVAPPEFLGDRGPLYGGTLSYDYRTTGNKDVCNLMTDMYADVQLIGGGMILEFNFPDPVIWEWTSYEVRLVARAGWRHNIDDLGAPVSWFFDETAPQPTEAEFQHVLANLEAIHLGTESVDGIGDTVTIDNIRFAAIPEIHATAWEPERMIDLQTLGGSWSEARDVNMWGEVVGVSETETGEFRAFYACHDVMYDLNDLIPIVRERDFRHLLAGDPSLCVPALRAVIEANAINDRGDIIACGTFWNDESLHGLLLVSRHEPCAPPLEDSFEVVDLGRLEGAVDCVPYGLNNEDLVVGASGDDGFLWSGAIDRLDDTKKDATAGMAINYWGDVAGWARVAGRDKPSLWLVDGRWIDLSPASPAQGSALDVNLRREVVGWIFPGRGISRRATLWSQDAGSPFGLGQFDLTLRSILPDHPGLSGYVLETAAAIDRDSRIAGTAVLPSGMLRAFWAVPFTQGE